MEYRKGEFWGLCYLFMLRERGFVNAGNILIYSDYIDIKIEKEIILNCEGNGFFKTYFFNNSPALFQMWMPFPASHKNDSCKRNIWWGEIF